MDIEFELGEMDPEYDGYQVCYNGLVIDIFYPLAYAEANEIKLNDEEIEDIETGNSLGIVDDLFEEWIQEPEIKRTLEEEARKGISIYER